MPRVRDEVKVVFSNGTLVEGLVLSWLDNKAEIFTKQGAVVEIFNITNNVLFVKVNNPQLDRDPELEGYIDSDEAYPYHPDLDVEEPTEGCEEVIQEKDPRVRAATIAELKIEKSKHLREIVAQRLKSKKKPLNKSKYYEPPNFTQPSAIQNTPTKNYSGSRRHPSRMR